MSIKYYHLAKDETPPEEFCAIRDVDGEPSEYTFYVPEAENAKLREHIHELEMEGSDHFYRTAYAEDANRTLEAENAKMRELVEDMLSCIEIRAAFGRPPTDEMYETFAQRARELGIEVTE